MKPETKAKIKSGYDKGEKASDSALQQLIAMPITVIVVVVILGLAAYGFIKAVF